MIRFLASVLLAEPVMRPRTPARLSRLSWRYMDAFEPQPPRSTPPMEVDEVRSLAAGD